MADSRHIVIELKAQNSASVSAGTNKSGTSENGEINLSALIHPIKSLEKATVGQNVLVNQAYQYAKQQIISVTKYEFGKYLSLTENYTAQQDLSNVMTAISKAASFGGAVLSGAMLGASIGGPAAPITAAVGAVIAGVGTAATEGYQILNRFREQNRDLATMNVQSNFQLVRMGLADGGRGTLN